MEKIVDIIAPRNIVDLIVKVIVLIVAFTAFDYFIGQAMMDLTKISIVAELVVTLLIAAPFGLFVMSIMAVQRRLKERLRVLAEVDQLTGLANRKTFLERATEKISEQPNSAVLMIDVDHFKAINDKYGHGVGDISLRSVGRYLMDSVRDVDVVGRLGGEEFAVLLIGSNRTLAESVSSRICQPIKINPAKHLNEDIPSFDLTMSVGIVIALPGQDLTALIRQADRALYSAKSKGRARAEFYEKERNDRRLSD